MVERTKKLQAATRSPGRGGAVESSARGNASSFFAIHVAGHRVPVLLRKRDAIERCDVIAQCGRASLYVAAEEDELLAVGRSARAEAGKESVVGQALLGAGGGGQGID